MTDGFANLVTMYEAADAIDRREGALAYPRYNALMAEISRRAAMPLDRVTAAFVALSPNNDYVGNVRSLLSLIVGIRDGVPVETINVATYNHCRTRAHAYLTGGADFLATARGPKIRAFYHNIMDPDDHRFVTVDGHISAAWRGDPNLTMKEALLRAGDYERISAGMFRLARLVERVPCAVQATIWFARKRTLNIKYVAQMDALAMLAGDVWGTTLDLDKVTTFGGKVLA